MAPILVYMYGVLTSIDDPMSDHPAIRPRSYPVSNARSLLLRSQPRAHGHDDSCCPSIDVSRLRSNNGSGLLAELVMAASSGVVRSTARPPQRPEVESSSGDPRGGCGDADRGAARSLFASDVLTGRAVTDSMWRGVLRQGLGRLRFLRSRGRDYASPPPERYITFCCCCLCWRTFFLSSPWSWSPKLYSFQDTRSGRRDLPLLTHS